MRSTLIVSISIVVLLLSGGFFRPTQAIEISDLHFAEVNKRHGLSDATVLDIVEDGMGYIWLATSNGLNRYSGYEDIKKYHPSDIDPNSIPAGFIQTLFVSSDGTLWVGTHAGLAKYQPLSDNFKVFNRANSVIKTEHITAISESTDGHILFADRKFLYKLDKKSEVVSVVTQLFNEESLIKVIFDEKDKTWVGSNEFGAIVIDKENGKTLRLSEPNPWNILVNVRALHDIEVINDVYWLATSDGIKGISPSGRLVGNVSINAEESNQPVNVLSLERVDNELWVGSTSGLYVINDVETLSNDKARKILHLNSDTYDATGLPAAIVIKVIQDRSGVVWAGTFRQGAFRYHPEYAKVHFQPVYNSPRKHEDNYSTIWGFGESSAGDLFIVSQQRGLGKLEKASGEITFFDLPASVGSDVTYWDLTIDKYDVIWLATSDGLKAIKVKSYEAEIVASFFDGEFIDNIHQDDNYIWIWLNQKGTFGVDYSNVFVSDVEKRIRALDSSQIANTVLPIYTDRLNRLWLRDDKTLYVYSLSEEKVVKRLDSNSGLNSIVYGVYETHDAYWLTSRSDGVIQINKETLNVENKQLRNDKHGYITSTIGIDNSIWYSDTSGLHQIRLPSLTEEDTILNADLSYNSLGEGAVLATSDGTIYFGGTRGFNKITKSLSVQYMQNKATLQPQLSQFSIFGTHHTYAKVSQDRLKPYFSTENITYAQQKQLNYDESRFSISFGLVNSVYPQQVAYRYKLTGFDDEWTFLEKENTAKFNNVSFGNYTFEVQAKEPGKAWSPSRVLDIHVARPPWLHTVALIFYGLVAFAIFGFMARQYQLRKANQRVIKDSEERLKLTLWSSGDELWDWDVYKGQVYRSNTWGTLDFPQDDIRTAGAYQSNIHPNDIERVKQSLREHLEGKNEFYELTYRAKTFNNQWIWILDRGKVVERDQNNQPIRMTGTLKNIQHLKLAEEQLNLFKRSIENISEGVFITNTLFKFISVNNAYCSYTGETRDQALASYMHFHLYPDAFTAEIKKTLKAKGNWSGEVESVRVNGERYEMELNIDAVYDEDGKISHFVGVFSDITSRKNTEKELLKLANVDPLTELPNRSFFQASHQNLVRKDTRHALLCLDMDNFKKINDSLGHQTGDILIKQIAKRLQRITGRIATCYRLGGDEFSILMEDTADIHTVTHHAQSLLDTLSRPFIINKQEFVLGASVGIAFYPDDGNSPQELLKNADTAMYFAKNNGGNSYQFFSGEMNQNAVRQLQIENLIRQGIKDDLFTVYYQPKVDITSGKLTSMEALVRFVHPTKGIVSPGQFIPLAEQTGQIIEIGEQVLRKACLDTKRWVQEGLFTGRVAVNISAKQFELPDLDDRINAILNEVGLSPLHLECEITEGTLMESPENALQMMKRLRERGIHLALDDFGTGYSSLAYLKRFPLNTLKIDRAFISDIANSNVDRHMVAAIINIAHNLGLKVVAEGVEEESQLDILRRYDCEMLQGFLYSRPLNAERFEKLLNENHQLHTILNQPNL